MIEQVIMKSMLSNLLTSLDNDLCKLVIHHFSPLMDIFLSQVHEVWRSIIGGASKSCSCWWCDQRLYDKQCKRRNLNHSWVTSEGDSS